MAPGLDLSEDTVRRNPHPNFQLVEESRPDWREHDSLLHTKTQKPDWRYGDGDTDAQRSLEKEHVEIDPYQRGRDRILNYKLLLSAVVPRPIGWISTRSKDGRHINLSPYSFFQEIGFDPPLFIIAILSDLAHAKDSLRNLLETGECVINMVPESCIEAVNCSAMGAPYGVSEFELTGLHPAQSTRVKAPRLKEAVFSVEAKLIEKHEYKSRINPDETTSILVVVEGVWMWAREDAINNEQSLLDINVMRPLARLGGISYSRVTDVIELLRPPNWESLPAEERERLESSGNLACSSELENSK